MHWNTNQFELVLGAVMILTGAAGLFSAYRRSAASVDASTSRSADLLTFFGVTIFGLTVSVQGGPRWLRLVGSCVAFACFASALLARRRAKRSGAT